MHEQHHIKNVPDNIFKKMLEDKKKLAVLKNTR